MTISDISIRRPVLATVLNLLIVTGGAIAYFMLPVREYPDVDYPVINIQTIYVGASPQTVEATITEPLEQVLNGIEGIRSIQSSSSFGQSSINVEFVAGRDVDLAATDVSNAIQRGLGELPIEAERPIVSKAGSEFQPIIWFGLVGDTVSNLDRTDLAERVVRTPLQLLPGVAFVRVPGQRYAMRVWLDPARMAQRGVDASDVRQAIIDNNLQMPAGEAEGGPRKFTINFDAQIDDPRMYERLVIRRDGDVPVRISDVGWVELGAENYRMVARSTGKDAAGVGIVRQSRSNELEVSKAVHAKVPEIERALPDGVDLELSTDQTIFVKATLAEVWTTLFIVFGLVMLVNLLFLRSLTTTLITGIAIPVSLVGTFAVAQVLGFSINVLTLLALVLAIGMLVDDSIVVLENIYRRQELGEPPLVAARNGSREVGFPVIATSAAVVAVLVPLSLMTGNTGRLFREFALTMAVSVIISTFVALTAVPMGCALFLHVQKKHGAIYNLIEAPITALANFYRGALAWFLHHRAIATLFVLATLLGTVWLLRGTPRTLVPTEDRGGFMVIIRAPQGSTTAYTERALQRVEAELAQIPEVQSYFGIVSFGSGGPGDSSGGMVFVTMKHWDERKVKQQEIVGRLFGKFMAIPYALVFPVNPPSLGGNRRSADVQIVLKSSSATLEEFAELQSEVVDRLRSVPGLVNVDSDMRLDNPQLDMHIDRERASDLGLSVRDVATSMRLLVSQSKSDEFILRAKQYDVVMALATQYRSVPEQLGEIHLRAASGAMVPLSSVATAVPSIGPATLSHYDLERAVTVTANLGPDATLGEVLPQSLAIVDEVLPSGFSTALGGVSREFVESAGSIYVTFGVALLIIYLVLAAQFESFIHPLTVMVSVPLATVGALGSLRLLGHSINIYSGIGLILLIGLVTKNSILLVDFANQERARGTDLLDSLRAAGRTRFRPILMTSMTSILGAAPLAMATGAGAESRQPIGAVVVGGLLFSTVFTLVMIPAIHYLIVRGAERLGFNMVPPLVELEAIEDEAAA